SIEKGASLFGLLTPVVLSTFPFIYQVHTGSIHKTTELFGTPAMVSAFINSIIWLMYGIVISKSDMSPTLLLLHAFTCMSTFTYLMFVYADRKATVKGYMLASSFILSLSVIFTVLYWDLIPSWIMEELFGCLGLGSLVYCHCIQISNILDGITERSQKIATAINLLPSCLVNLETMMITAQRHPNHGFILMSSTLGFAANVLEIFLAIIVSILGNLFSSTGNRSVDLEAAVQNVGRANVSAGLPTNDLAVVFGSENSIAGSTQAQHQRYIVLSVWTLVSVDVVSGLVAYHSFLCTVVLVQAIPRVPLQIERDAYLPMLLQISGLA
uniref:Bidirectional sugar transporter SWEET n=1 Tax=Setaria italica TaxID=4555 RepID=K3YC84_SETIT